MLPINMDNDARKPDAESTKVIAELAAKEYSDEHDRMKALDSKTAPLIAATGALILFVAGFLSKAPAPIPGFWSGVYFAVVILTLGTLVVAQLFFFRALRVQEYKRLQLSEWVSFDSMSAPSEELRGQLASTYEEAVIHNRSLNEKKAVAHHYGLLLASVSIIVLACLLTVANAIGQTAVGG